MNLVVGATGAVGLKSAACSGARESQCGLSSERRRTRPSGASLSRSASSSRWATSRARLHSSTPAADVVTLLSTASSTLSRQEGDSIESVDLRGHLHLVQAARKAGRATPGLSSRSPSSLLDFPLQTAKRAVENEIVSSGIPYTILQPIYLMETWLSPALASPRGRKTPACSATERQGQLARGRRRGGASRRQPSTTQGSTGKILALAGRSAVGGATSCGSFARPVGPRQGRARFGHDLETQMNAAGRSAPAIFQRSDAHRSAAVRSSIQAALDIIPLDLTTVRRSPERSFASLLN